MLPGLERLLRFSRRFFDAITASDFTQRFGRTRGSSFESISGLRAGWKRLLLLASNDAILIILRQNLRAVEIFIRVDVSFFLLGGGFAGFFLTRGFGDVLRLGRCAIGNETEREGRDEEYASA